jgi:hypothetical protein
MGDGEAEALCRLEIDIDVGAGINDGTDMRCIVAQQVRTFGDAIGQDLFEAQGHRFSP